MDHQLRTYYLNHMGIESWSLRSVSTQLDFLSRGGRLKLVAVMSDDQKEDQLALWHKMVAAIEALPPSLFPGEKTATILLSDHREDLRDADIITHSLQAMINNSSLKAVVWHAIKRTLA